MPKTKEVISTEFKTVVRQVGNSGHIIVPKSLLGKTVKVTIEVLD